MHDVEAYEIAKNIFIIDTGLHSFPHFGAVYLVKGEQLALMEAGDHTTGEVVLSGIRRLGFSPEDIAYIFCSHIHLDHSGAAGRLVARMPRAQVVVHEKAAKHIIDPSAMLASYGSFGGDPTLRSLVRPVPSSQVTPVKGGERFSLGKGKTVQVIATPGHSPTSVSYLYGPQKSLFCGDALGIYLAEDKIFMPSAGPGYDYENTLASIETLAAIGPEGLFFPHYGLARNVAQVMQLAQERCRSWGQLAIDVLKAGDSGHLEDTLRERARQEVKEIENRKSLFAYMTGDLIALSARGYETYYRTKIARGTVS